MLSPIRRRLQLIFIPVTLAVIAAATFVGPWGAYSSSKRSQFARLETVLGAVGALSGGKLTKVTEGTNAAAAGEAANIVRYLVRTHGARPMREWLAARDFPVGDLPPDTTRYIGSHAESVVSALGLQGFDGSGRPQYLSINRQVDGAVEVTGFDWLVPLRQRAPVDTVWPGGDTLAAGISMDGRSLEVRRGGQVVTEIGLGAVIDMLADWRLRTPHADVPPDSLLVARAADGSAVLYMRLVGLRDSAGIWHVEHIDGEVVVRR